MPKGRADKGMLTEVLSKTRGWPWRGVKISPRARCKKGPRNAVNGIEDLTVGQSVGKPD